MYSLVNPHPHFLVGDICQVVGTIHEVVIKEINCNKGQINDHHQWSYSIHGTKDVNKVAWYHGNELKLITPIMPHHTMQFQTRRVSMHVQTNQTMIFAHPLSAASHPLPGYPIGTILHGNVVLRHNLWIITIDNSYEASLLYDGRQNLVAPNSLHKRDRMSPGMRIADLHNVTLKIGTLPVWAKHLILTTHKPSQSLLPKPSSALPPAVLQQINKSFAAITPQKKLNDLGLTKSKYGGFQSIHADSESNIVLRDCPARQDGYCFYEPYYGFTDDYQYCVHCDHKKAMPK